MSEGREEEGEGDGDEKGRGNEEVHLDPSMVGLDQYTSWGACHTRDGCGFGGG